MSRKLSYHLRHNGDILQEDGYVSIQSIMQLPDFANIDKGIIMQAAQNPRFEIHVKHDNSDVFVRSLYGHTVPLPDYIRPVLHFKKAPKVLIHCTTHAHLSSIRRDGICPSSRTHIHLTLSESPILNKQKFSVAVKVDLKQMLRDNYIFHPCSKDVFLTPYRIQPQIW